MNTRLLAAVLTAALAVTAAQADKVLLKSGSSLTGTAGKIDGDKLVFTSDDIGEVKIDLKNIVVLESEGSHQIVYADDSQETTTALTVDQGVLNLNGQKLDMSKVKAIDPAVETWHGSVNVSYQSNRGNTYKNAASLLADVNRRWEKDRVKGNFGYYYSETGTTKDNKEKDTDRWEIEGQHDHFWSTAFYNYESARYEQDKIAGLDSRLRLGLGGGYQWLDKGSFDSLGVLSFNQELGAAWIKADYKDRDPDAESSYATLRYAHHLTYLPKWHTDVEVFHNLEYLPQVDDWANFLMKSDIGLTTKIIMNFDLLMKIEWDYNSCPSVGRKSSDTRYIVGLGYKW